MITYNKLEIITQLSEIRRKTKQNCFVINESEIYGECRFFALNRNRKYSDVCS